MKSILRPSLVALLLALGLPPASAQIITTIAGTQFIFPRFVRAVDAPLDNVTCVATDTRGNVYLCDASSDIIAKVSRDGMLTVVAGTGIRGTGTGAFKSPSGMAVDSAGNLYIADTGNHRIRKIAVDGSITTVAGTGSYGFSGDGGAATKAQLYYPWGVAVDPAGTLYVGDRDNHRVRKVTAGGTITTVAGTGSYGFSGDGGPATGAKLGDPHGVAIDAAGNVYISDYDLPYGRIRKVNPQGTISTLVTSATLGYFSPYGLTADASGNVYVAEAKDWDFGRDRVWKVDPNGGAAVIAGGGSTLGDGGPATAAALSGPLDVAVDTVGNVYIADSKNHRVRKVGGLRTITTLAGIGQPALSGDGGGALGATLSKPAAVVADGAGNIYVADSSNGRIRKISPQGLITTAVGGGTGVGDGGPATGALLVSPQGLFFDGIGNFYIADPSDHRVRRVDPQGTITTVAGNGSRSYDGDGSRAASTGIGAPAGVNVDASGNFFIADTYYNRVYKVNSQGIISRVAGTQAGWGGFSGDGGPATQAQLRYPSAAVADAAGNLYIADTDNHRIRRVSPQGTITTVAGVGTPASSGDGGQATNAAVNGPTGLWLDGSGNLYIADTKNNRIRKLDASGVITSVAGTGTGSMTGDGGSPLTAGLNAPQGVTVDTAGNIYIADTGNDRIRAILSRAPTYTVSPQRLTFTADAGSGLAPAQQIGLIGSMVGLGWEVSGLYTDSGGNWLSVPATSGLMPALISVNADATRLAAGSYQGSIEITAPSAAPAVTTISVTFTVTGGAAAGLSVQPPRLDFRVRAGTSAPGQWLRIENTGGGTLNWTAGAAVTVGSWLAITPASGAAPANLQVSVNPAGLSPGSYAGSITIQSGAAGQSVTIPVNLLISSATAGVILLSQTSLMFRAVEGGGVDPPQAFGVLNIGAGAMDWSAQATESWLRISPASGRSDAGSTQIPEVTVSVDPTSLKAGFYVALIRATASGANNSPQVVRVEMQVMPAGTKLGASVRPTGLIFVAAAGGAAPAAQEVAIATPETSPIQFVSQPIGGTWVTRFPDSGNASRDNPGRILVQANVSGLAAGVYRAGLTVMTMNDGELHPVNVLLLVLPAGASIQAVLAALRDSPSEAEALVRSLTDGPVAASGCTASKLLLQFTSLFARFNAVVGWPSTIRVEARDDCGSAAVGATVLLSFSNGDPPLVLTDLKNGQYQGQWSPGSTTAQVAVTAQALWQNLQGQATAAAQVGLNPNPRDVTLSQGGVLLGAGFERGPVAPGSIVSLFGQNLTTSAAMAQTLPLPRTLNGVRVLVGEKEAPLFYVGPSQVNAQVPFELESDRQLQVRIEVNGVSSAPEPLQTSAARPGIFTLGPPYGNQGAILIANTDKLAMPVTAGVPGEPTTAGGVISIFCTGLGATDPAVASGQPGPAAEPLARVKTPVTVTIGGKPATVYFAGFAPGFAALYQVNAQVPADVAPGDAVPVVITQGGFASNTATIAVR
jgi:uncharacterized protein (TIGR03437 family)